MSAARKLLIAAALLASTPAWAETAPDTRYRIEQEATRKAAMRWEAAFVVLSAADLAITVQCLKADTCTEANPLAKSHSPETMIAIKSALTLGHFFFVKRLSERNPKAALRVAQVSVLAQGTVVGLNIRTAF